MNLEEADAKIQDCPKTIFDKFDLTIDFRSVGGALRGELVTLTNLYGRINQLTSNSYLCYEQAKNRKDVVSALAWEKVDRKQSVTAQKILVRAIVVKIDKEETTLAKEEERVNLFAYVYSRGKDKTKEISTLLDMGRTFLSWDKTEHSKSQY